MKLKLNELQETLLEIAKQKGHVTIEDASALWTSKPYQVANIKRFVVAGILKTSAIPGKFEYNA